MTFLHLFPRGSIARRIAVALTGLMIMAVLLLAFTVFYVYRGLEKSLIDELIKVESSRLVTRLSNPDGRWQAPFERDMSPLMFAWGETSAMRAPSMPPELRELEPGLHHLEGADSVWYVLVTPLMDGHLYVLYDSIVLEKQSFRFALDLLLIVSVFSILAFLISIRVSRWIVAPLNVLTNRLARWAPGDPEQDSLLTNEADRLMDAFNRVQDQVDRAIADQREFSANLHHEIRTPLTVIRSDAELLLLQARKKWLIQAPTGSSIDSGPVARLQRMIRAVDDITASLESTYYLSQAQNGKIEEVSLHDCVQDILASLQYEAAQAGLVLHNGVDVGQVQTLNRYALMTVMRNIIRNAIQHATPADLRIESMENGLQFTDTGAGIAADELAHVFDRYYSRRRRDSADAQNQQSAVDGIRQSGLGLAIAMRVCTLQEWQLKVESPVQDGRGTRFTVRFVTTPEEFLTNRP